MVAEVKRGVKFVLGTAVDPGAIKAFEAIEKRVDALQKRMNMTLSVTERASHAANGVNGSGSGSSISASARAAERAMQLRERAAERAFKLEAKWNREAEAAVAKREAAEARAAQRTEREAKRAADTQAREAKRAADAQIREIRRVEQEQERAVREAAREDARGWRRLSAIGKEQYISGKKVGAGFDALSAMGRAAMPRDRFAEGLARMGADRASRTGFSGLGAAGAETVDRLEAMRALRSADAIERRRQIDETTRGLREQRRELRELNGAAYDVAHAFGQLTRAAAQFNVVGQRDAAKILDLIFATEGSINAVQGVMGAHRAISGMRGATSRASLGPAAALSAGPLARLLGAGMRFTGTRSIGGLAAVGGAGATAAVAGGIGLLGTAADYRRGVGPGHVGGFWDTLGKGIASPVGSVQGGFLSLGSAIERRLNEPYGLTDRESDFRSQRLQEEEFERSFGTNGANDSRYAAIKRAKLHERRTELMEKYTNREMDRREAMRLRREEIDSFEATGRAQQQSAKLEAMAQRYGVRQSAMGLRAGALGNLHGEAFSRQQAAYGEQLALSQRRALGQFVSPEQAARAAAEQAREEGRATSFYGRRLNNLRTQQSANYRQYVAVSLERDRANAAYNSADSEAGRNAAFQARQDAEERLKKIAQESLDIAERKRQVGIEGARHELEIRQQTLATAKQTADTLRQTGQSATERFGRLLPGQQRAVIHAAESAASGKQLNRFEADLLRPFGDVFEEQLRGHDVGRARAGGVDRFLELSGHTRRQADANQKEGQAVTGANRAEDELAGKIYDSADRAGTDLANLIVPFVEKAFAHFVEEVDKKIKAATHEMVVRERQQGRAMAGQ